LLSEWVEAEPERQRKTVFVLCGPEPMVAACFKILRPVISPENIWASVEYMTSCGVGICGKCASPSGALTCIDGPFLLFPEFQARAAKKHGSCATQLPAAVSE
jgi:dihydroorotate dehydrogenase (NAD+) catalytic subunit